MHLAQDQKPGFAEVPGDDPQNRKKEAVQMENKRTLEEVRKLFEADRFATENGAVIEEIGDHYARCSLMLTDSHRNAMGAVMGGTYFMLADFAFAVEYDSEGSDSDCCEAIYLGFADRTVDFCGVKLGQEDEWQKKLLLARPDAVHLPKKRIFLIPDDRIIITEAPKRIHWLPQSRYDIWAEDYQKAEARLK